MKHATTNTEGAVPTDTAAPPDLLVTQGEARRRLVPFPAVAADTASGVGLSVMRAEADSRVSTSTDGALPTDTAAPPDFIVRTGEARRMLVSGNEGCEPSQTDDWQGQADNEPEEEAKVLDPVKLFDMQAEESDCFVTDHSNITTWPRHVFARGLGSSKAYVVRTSIAHVNIVGETHALGLQEEEMARHVNDHKNETYSVQKQQPWTEPAEATSHCGVMMMARSYLSLTPVAVTEESKSLLRTSPSSYWAAIMVNFQSGPVIFFGAYCRGGIESEDSLEVRQALRRITDGGKRLFVAMPDWNAATSEIEDSGWLSLLRASVVSAEVATVVSREVDFAVVSQGLCKADMGNAASWLTPFSPLATVRLAISRAKADLST